jgi:hypothetical protein
MGRWALKGAVEALHPRPRCARRTRKHNLGEPAGAGKRGTHTSARHYVAKDSHDGSRNTPALNDRRILSVIERDSIVDRHPLSRLRRDELVESFGELLRYGTDLGVACRGTVAGS